MSKSKQELYSELSTILAKTPDKWKQIVLEEFCKKNGLDIKKYKREVDPLKITKRLTRKLPTLPFKED